MAVLKDADVQAKWQAISPLIDRMMGRVGTKDEFPVSLGSSLAGDDKASDPYQVSHVLRMCLGAGVDHLHAAKVLVVDQGVLHVAAPSSLARGALENLAAAYWVLGPSGRDERVTRALRWHAKNMKDGNTALAPLGLPGITPVDDKLKKLYAVGAKRGIDEKAIRQGYTSTATVEYAEQGEPSLPLGVVLPWRLCSGYAHGRPWAYLGASEREEAPSTSADLVNVQLRSSLSRALYPNLSALQLLERFLRLDEARADYHLA